MHWECLAGGAASSIQPVPSIRLPAHRDGRAPGNARATMAAQERAAAGSSAATRAAPFPARGKGGGYAAIAAYRQMRVFAAMARFRESVVINQPVERVFAFVSDFENDPLWSGIPEVHRTSPGPLGTGTTFGLRQRFLGRRLDVVLEVIRYEPSRVITVKTASGRFVSMTGTRLAEPAGDAAQLTFLGTGHARGMLRPLEPLLAAAASGRRLRTQLGRLKQALEAQP